MAKSFLCTKTEPVVQTKAGKLRGFQFNGTYTFHGIDYARARRFQQPQEVESWEGIKDAMSYGYVCPLLHQEKPSGEVMVPHRYWPMDENCLNLNLWTQTLDPNGKRPVLVWLHGGGFSAGSAIEHVAYEGENMSRHGDVVVVSVNHRLNVLGYLDLSPFGEKYRNCGNADMVAALKWIRDNIAAFGGDPENVTLFGQSGGGMKVWTLMQTPEADGLFHKGIVQSGLIEGFMENEKPSGKKVVNALLKKLGYPEGNAEPLETVPYAQLAQAYTEVAPELQKQGEYVGCTPIPNDWYLGDPRFVGFTPHAQTIPVMVGTAFGEFSFGPALENRNTMSMEEKKTLLEKKYGASWEELLGLFQKAYPEKDISDLLYIDSVFRWPSIDFIEKKARHPQAPTYSYLFSYVFPYDGGHVAWHCSEIPFVFYNIDKVPVCNEPGVTEELQEAICDAWINFAKTGNPENPHLPGWPTCKEGDEAVMIFDRTCQVRHNFDRALMELHNRVTPKWGEEEPEEPIQH